MFLYQIESSFFTAGLLADNDVVVTAAPIIKYMVGWTMAQVNTYCYKRRWQIERVK